MNIASLSFPSKKPHSVFKHWSYLHAPYWCIRFVLNVNFFSLRRLVMQEMLWRSLFTHVCSIGWLNK